MFYRASNCSYWSNGGNYSELLKIRQHDQRESEKAFVTTMMINSILAILIFILFLISKHLRPKLYQLLPHHKPPSQHMFAWVLPIFNISMSNITKSHGLDVVMYIHFIRMCLKIVVGLLVYGLFVTLPINITGKNNQIGTAILSMSNIESCDTMRFSLHTVGMIYNTLVVFFFLYKYYRLFVLNRLKDKQRKSIENYTVCITGFNEKKWTAYELEEFFNKLFPGMVYSVHVVPWIPQLDALHQRRFNYVKLKEEKITYLKKKGKTEIGPSILILDSKIEKIDEKIRRLLADPTTLSHYPTSQRIKDTLPRLEKLNVAISKRFSKSSRDSYVSKHTVLDDDRKHLMVPSDASSVDLEEQHADVSKYMGKTNASSRDLSQFLTRTNKLKEVDDNVCTNTAYITFRSMISAHTCACIVAGNTPKWQVFPAPDPQDIFWKNHFPNVASIGRRLWFLLGVSIQFFLILFWIFPTTFATGLSNLENIKVNPSLEFLHPIIVWLEENKLKSFVEGILPHLVILFFFLILLPIIKLLVNTTAIPINRTEKIHDIMIVYYTFKIVNIYCIGLLTASIFKIFDQLRAIIEQPLHFLELLGQAVPAQVLFFLNFVMTSALRESMLRLWRPWSLFYELFGLYCCVVTPRDYRRLYKPEVFEYFEAYPDKAFILVMVLCYSNIAPLILVFGLIYFMIMYLSDTYRLLYVCQSKSHSGGILWSTAFNQVCFGVGLYHVTMIGIFIIKGYLPGVIVGFLLVLITILFNYYMNTRWYPIAYYGSMESLLEKDDIVAAHDEAFRFVYWHPSLLPVPEKKNEYYGEDRVQDDLPVHRTTLMSDDSRMSEHDSHHHDEYPLDYLSNRTISSADFGLPYNPFSRRKTSGSSSGSGRGRGGGKDDIVFVDLEGSESFTKKY